MAEEKKEYDEDYEPVTCGEVGMFMRTLFFFARMWNVIRTGSKYGKPQKDLPKINDDIYPPGMYGD